MLCLVDEAGPDPGARCFILVIVREPDTHHIVLGAVLVLQTERLRGLRLTTWTTAIVGLDLDGRLYGCSIRQVMDLQPPRGRGGADAHIPVRLDRHPVQVVGEEGQIERSLRTHPTGAGPGGVRCDHLQDGPIIRILQP